MESELPADPARDSEPVSERAPEQSTPVPAAVPLPEMPGYRDRGTGLVIFGVLQIILGLLAALMVPLVALGAFMSRLGPGGAMRPGQFISGSRHLRIPRGSSHWILGIGSLQMKRWAHALTLVTSWYGLITGALVTVLLTAALPVAMRSALAQAQQNAPRPSPAISTGVMAVILTVIIIFAAVFLILVPIAFVVFYSRADVAETCRRRDPIPRWTDRTPLPVLGASVVLAIGAALSVAGRVSRPRYSRSSDDISLESQVQCAL